jgi:histone demethylase JARID1
MVEREIADRQTALTQITNLSPDILIEPADLPEDQVQCHHCKAFAFLSQLTCPDSPNVSCLNHAHIFGDSQKILRCKYTDEELQTMLMRVNSRSVKAGRVVDTSAIEQRTSGRKVCPAYTLFL